MVWGWFGGLGAERSPRGGVEGRGRRWLLARSAPLGAEVSGLRAPAGDAAPLVVRRSAAVEVLAYLSAGAGAGVGAECGPGGIGMARPLSKASFLYTR